ncbi:MAG TPA: acyl-CoA dehydratase activase [Candidatus Limnocylindria bacterium]|nr:acyl-CoA dehydratase activase [Candidatus Limnocylindria bacterium]
MRYAAGVDVGSTQTKAAVVDQGGRIVGRSLTHTGAYLVKAAERAFLEALAQAGASRDDVGYVVGTGYGRFNVAFGDAQVTEISCHAKGAWSRFPATRTVIDIGGQDTKAIKVSDRGEVLDFSMNDKCAAGSGRFLTNSAEAVGMDVSAIGERSLEAKQPVRLSTVCTVFVESDILSYLAQGKKVEDILAGVHASIAARTVALVRRVGAASEVTFTGGVSKNIGMQRALEEKLALTVNVSDDSHYTGAIGAAIFALERMRAGVPGEAVA